MRVLTQVACVGVSLIALSAPAFAQTEQAGEGVAEPEIIVQARRRDESIQDVPLTVNAVSAETIEKLNIRDLKDITAVVPGLVLEPGNRTTGVVASLRGLNVDVNSSGANTSVQFYLNDSVISAGAVLQAMYDIGQVEVLRGPQGTLRGLASPSGSITITTKKPVMDEAGGYAQGTVNSIGGHNVNGAINMPVIKDILAVRVAGVIEDNESNRVRSINSSLAPSARTRGIRASARFMPTDSIELNASYNYLIKNFVTFDQVESSTLANSAIVPTGAPATNRFITARDRLAVEDVPNIGRQVFNIFNWQAKWSFAGQRLDYVGSYAKQDFRSTEPYDKGDYFGTSVPGDASLPNNNETYITPAAGLNAQNAAQVVHLASTQETHEVRLSSEDRVFGMFDYVAGLFMTKQVPWTDLTRVTSVNSATGVASTTQGVSQRRGRTIERAAFANLTAHIGDRTEVSGGIRFINYQTSTNASSVAVPFGPSETFKATIWTASVKHKFTDDLMVYASAGSSFRVGSGTNGLILASSGSPPVTAANVRDPYLAALFPTVPERSKSYEIGLRSTWLDKRLTVNLSAFHQDFTGYIYPVDRFYFLNNVANAPIVNAGNGAVAQTRSTLAASVPAKINGIEAEVAFRPSDYINLSANVAYAKATMTGQLPCVFTTPPTAADLSQVDNQQVCLKTVNQSAGRLAPFSANFQGEYRLPITDTNSAFVRGLLRVYGDSENDPQNPYDDIPAYALFNLYAGVRADDGRWEVTAYAKNLFNTFRVISRFASAEVVNGSTASNYRLVTATDPREFGLTARFAFGSR